MTHLLWIRSEVFDHGVFNTSVRWTVSKVFDFLASLKDVVGSSSVRKDAWTAATSSRTTPTLNEAEQAAYWQVITVLQQSIMGDTKDVLDIRIIGLILFCQVFTLNRVGKTDQFARSGEMWPGMERGSATSSPRASPRGTSPRGISAHFSASGAAGTWSRGKDFASAVMAFVRQHFGQLMQIACWSLAAEPASIRAEEFDVLGLILRAGLSFSVPIWRISEAVPGLIAHAMSTRELKAVVEKCLVWNEEVYSFEASSQLQVPLSKTINIMGISKSTWFQRPQTASVDYLYISGCTDCCIYVTGSIRFCLIAGCHDCTIVLGGVSTLCTVHNCEKISVHVAAHCFKMENSIDSSAYVYCHVAPILTGDTRGIKLAPYNVMFSGLNAVLEAANMKQEPDFSDVWAHPICSTLGSPDETLRSHLETETNSTYHFVRPAQFIPIVVPEAERRGPCDLVLPEVYSDVLEQRKQEMKAFHEQLAEIRDESRQRKAHQAIQGHFREWLQTTGKSRQLADLVKLSAQLER